MLTRLKLSNFKAWRESGDVRLAPVTLLLGENSTGKSSLLQSLLLMKQTAASPDRTVHLNLSGDEANDYVDMGSFDDLLTRKPGERKVGIEIDACHEKAKCHFVVEYAQDSKKIIAACLKGNEKELPCTIVNACDTDWYDWQQALESTGVEVEQLIDKWARQKWREHHDR